jgi:hypothetical protein
MPDTYGCHIDGKEAEGLVKEEKRSIDQRKFFPVA